MRVTITSINFKYDEGHDKDYTGVELQYITRGFKFSNNDPIEITKEEYELNKGNSDKLRGLVIDEKLEEANAFIGELNEYKDSLSAE